MTGVTTQQPVAWQNSLKPCEIYADDDLELVWKQCPTFLPLYTTDQAEAYAAAKVRESQEWQPIETAPTGNNPDGAIFLMIAWGSDGDKSTGIGMRWRDKWFSAAVFFCLNQDRKYEFREKEIQPTHWRPIPPMPTE